MAASNTRLAEAIRWSNGMVMTFGPCGEQLPDLQGPYEEVRTAVLARADARTRFFRADWQVRIPEEVKREEW